MIILGIDPGYATIGCGVIAYNGGRFQVLEACAVTTPAKSPFEKRLLQIEQEVGALIDRFAPDALAIEQLFFGQNTTTALAVAHARGVILLAAAKRDLEPFEYGPSQVKQAVVGFGGAEKRQVMEMTKRILNLSALPRPDDVADALAVAICHAHSGTGTWRRESFKTGTQGGRR